MSTAGNVIPHIVFPVFYYEQFWGYALKDLSDEFQSPIGSVENDFFFPSQSLPTELWNVGFNGLVWFGFFQCKLEFCG